MKFGRGIDFGNGKEFSENKIIVVIAIDRKVWKNVN